jgi:hypothetical protein
MKIKWKHVIVRLVPLATAAAAVVTAISGHAANIRLG